MKPYQPRNFQFDGIAEINGWQLKMYTIKHHESSDNEALRTAGMELLSTELPDVGKGDHGLGFVIFHAGLDSNFVVLDWWHNENELCHRVFSSTKAAPGKLRRRQPDESIACIWDLLVIHHERESWVKHMMRNPPEAATYLSDVYKGLH